MAFDPNEVRARKREVAKLVKVWNTGIMMLDRSELRLRDVIERELSEVAGFNGVRIGEAMQATDKLMKKITVIRAKAIKAAFTYVRDRLGNGKIHDRTLAQWAAHFARTEAKRIDNAIRSGLTSGLENTEIARSVVGSQLLRGVDGVTEITRHQISQLARVTLKQRK